MRRTLRPEPARRLLLGVSLLLALAAGGSLPPAAAQAESSREGFLDLWRIEVLDGEHEEAARLYEKLYESKPTAPLSRIDRERAAYRAGRCWEAAGWPRRAAVAYRWLERDGSSGALLVERARERLRVLRRLAPSGGELPEALDGPLPSLEAGSRVATVEAAAADSAPGVGDLLVEIDREIERWRARLAGVEKAVRVRRERVGAIEALLGRLSALGLDLDFEVGEARPARSRLAAAFRRESDADDEAWEVARHFLADRLLSRGLAALSEGDSRAARRELALARSLDPTEPEAEKALELINEAPSIATAAELASRRLRARREARRAALRQSVSAALRRAAALDRRSRALAALEMARREVEIAPAYRLADPEITRLVERLRDAWITAGGKAAETALEVMWAEARQPAGACLGRALQWLELARREEEWLRPPAARSPEGALEILRAEWLRLAADARGGNSGRGRDGSPRVALQREMIETWMDRLAGSAARRSAAGPRRFGR